MAMRVDLSVYIDSYPSIIVPIYCFPETQLGNILAYNKRRKFPNEILTLREHIDTISPKSSLRERATACRHAYLNDAITAAATSAIALLVVG